MEELVRRGGVGESVPRPSGHLFRELRNLFVRLSGGETTATAAARLTMNRVSEGSYVGDPEEVVLKEGRVFKQGRGMISKSWAERYLIVGEKVTSPRACSAAVCAPQV